MYATHVHPPVYLNFFIYQKKKKKIDVSGFVIAYSVINNWSFFFNK